MEAGQPRAQSPALLRISVHRVQAFAGKPKLMICGAIPIKDSKAVFAGISRIGNNSLFHLDTVPLEL